MSPNDIRSAKGAADWFLRDMQALAEAKKRYRSQNGTGGSIQGPTFDPDSIPIWLP